MGLEILLLQKEELLIVGENRFQIPIYPSLLRAEVVFDKTIAVRIFPLAAQEWYSDLEEYVTILPENTNDERARKKWLKESYLDKSLVIEK